MSQQQIVRETPAPSIVEFTQPDPSKPDVGPSKGDMEEPVLEIEDIQGNIINGFNKDHRMLVFLRIDDAQAFKVWLKSQVAFIATAAEVLAFNRLFKETRTRRGREGAVKSTWVNIAFTFQALKKLSKDANEFKDPAFRDTFYKRAKSLGDPVDKNGNPINWVVGGAHNPEVHVMLIVESDERNDLSSEVNRIEESITNFAPQGQQIPSGVSIVHYDEGNSPPLPLPNLSEQGGGHDPIIGQNNQDPNRIREFTVTVPDSANPRDLTKAKAFRVSTKDPKTGKGIEWVIPTGGGYFFAPSIRALYLLAGAKQP